MFNTDEIHHFKEIYGGTWPKLYRPLGLRFNVINGYATQLVILSDGRGGVYLCRDRFAHYKLTKGEFNQLPVPIPLPIKDEKPEKPVLPDKIRHDGVAYRCKRDRYILPLTYLSTTKARMLQEKAIQADRPLV